MKNGKVSILGVAQWSKKVKILFDKSFDPSVLKTSRPGVGGENHSTLAWKMAKLAFLMLHSGKKGHSSIWKKNDHCFLKMSSQEVFVENFSSLEWTWQGTFDVD